MSTPYPVFVKESDLRARFTDAELREMARNYAKKGAQLLVIPRDLEPPSKLRDVGQSGPLRHRLTDQQAGQVRARLIEVAIPIDELLENE
jgi:hypothetical protein